jgi:hypothetical protein
MKIYAMRHRNTRHENASQFFAEFQRQQQEFQRLLTQFAVMSRLSALHKEQFARDWQTFYSRVSERFWFTLPEEKAASPGVVRFYFNPLPEDGWTAFMTDLLQMHPLNYPCQIVKAMLASEIVPRRTLKPPFAYPVYRNQAVPEKLHQWFKVGDLKNSLGASKITFNINYDTAWSRPRG